MNQPKFKFGETVSRGSIKFTVKDISYCTHETWLSPRPEGYYYKDNLLAESWHHEDTLELCREPRRKKLYAYRSYNGYINFKEQETQIHATEQDGFYVNTKLMEGRAPEYDIEYPDPKETPPNPIHLVE